VIFPFAKTFLLQKGLYGFVLERFPWDSNSFHPLQPEIAELKFTIYTIITRGCWKSIDGDEVMVIDDGVEMGIGDRMKLPEPEILRRGTADS
jgi:hypothetical protein